MEQAEPVSKKIKFENKQNSMLFSNSNSLNKNFLKVKLRRKDQQAKPKKSSKVSSSIKLVRAKKTSPPTIDKPPSPVIQQQQQQSCIQIIQINTTAQFMETSISTSQIDDTSNNNVDLKNPENNSSLNKESDEPLQKSNYFKIADMECSQTPLDLTVKK
jgi:hypothetical protein